MASIQSAIIRKPQLLIVDDEPMIREILKDYLQLEGYLVQVAASGEAALKMIKHGHFDLMLTDLKMPKMDGITLLRHIREINEDLICVMMTGFGTVEAAVDAMKNGAYEFILKPFEPENVAVVLQKALAHQRLQRENSTLKEQLSLYKLSEAMAGEMPIDDKLSMITDLVRENFGADGVSIVTKSAKVSKEFVVRQNNGMRVELSSNSIFAEHKKGHTILGEHEEAQKYIKNADKPGEAVSTFMSVPLKVRGSVFGMLTAYCNDPNRRFTETQHRALSIYSGRAAEAIETDRAHRSLKESFTETIEGFARALEAKDAYTAGHSDRVAHYSALIAEAMGLPVVEVDRVRHGGLLHDVGKIGIRSSDLNKAQKLTPDEYLMFQSHPVIGRRIIEPISFLVYLVPCVYHHHESFDGSGYPEGLDGEGIPIEARILSVADSYDAMTSDRPYRKALPHDIAIAELKRCQNRQFDPDVVQAFFSVIHDYRDAKRAKGEAVPR